MGGQVGKLWGRSGGRGRGEKGESLYCGFQEKEQERQGQQAQTLDHLRALNVRASLVV